MLRSPRQLREDALAIWQAGVAAVASDRLVREQVRADGGSLWIGELQLELAGIRRITVVGAGKAGAGMAAGLEETLGDALMEEKQLVGWVNVPADCVIPLRRIRLHAARPAGLNEPTAEGVTGALRVLELVGDCQADDLCICLISGGGSALLPAPIEGITLADKQAVTRQLSAAGANIEQLNTVRKQLSRIKGGGLLRACRAGRLVTLIISDVIGDPLDVIASGPTIANSTGPADALRVLAEFRSREAGIPAHVFGCIEQLDRPPQPGATQACQAINLIIGSNAVAVDAAGIEAERRGYSHAMTAARNLEGHAEEVGRHLAEMALRMTREAGPDCLITGGEPTVQLVDAEQRGLGGRNQQLVLAALQHCSERLPANNLSGLLEGIMLLSGGTDGEDGPTDAAGAFIDADVSDAVQREGLDPRDYLRRNDAYHFFQAVDALIRTGPTHTNVCDVRVVTVSRPPK